MSWYVLVICYAFERRMLTLEFLQSWRAQLGRFGVSGSHQTSLIKQLSDGLRNRFVLSLLIPVLSHLQLKQRRVLTACHGAPPHSPPWCVYFLRHNVRAVGTLIISLFR